MEGSWGHRTDHVTREVLEIGGNSRGYIYKYLENALVYDSNPRKWFVKDDLLRFGRISGADETFAITTYPVTASSPVISAYDTVDVGQVYMVLDNVIYEKVR